MNMKAQRRGSSRVRGFTLIEVMVALIIIAIGMLGIAKLQGLALSNTGASSMRSLAAIQATSLASAMHANRAYWAASTAPSFVNTYNAATQVNTLTVSSGAITIGALSACQNTVCATAGAVASADLATWLKSLNATLPSATETVNCDVAVQPTSCTIQIEWTENIVGANSQEAVVATANVASGANANAQQKLSHPTYVLYVTP
jgi:type IV pilus assembly protein PilV